MRTFLPLFALLGLSQAFRVPAKYADREILSAHPTVTGLSHDYFSAEQFAQLVNEVGEDRLPTTQVYPGYKKGTIKQSDDCGVPGPNGRITGGNEATPHEYPWMAAVYMSRGASTYFCGGTIISETYVMTAAHCVDDFDSIEVYLGAHNVSMDAEDGRLEKQAAEFYPHPDWHPNIIKNDIGLIRFATPIVFTENIRPICLPAYSDANTTYANITAPASGWGKESDDAEGMSDVLREVETETIPNDQCIRELVVITNDNICISGADGKSTCNGDSGGPLHFVMEDGRMKQIGITSFGLVFGCEKDLYAAFTRTTSYLGFIETETGIQIDP